MGSSAKIGSILVDLRAGFASLSSDLGKGNAVLSRGLQNLERTAQGFAKIVQGYIGLQAGRALVGFAMQSVNTADHLVKLSASTGVSVEELSSLSHAANLAGVDMDGVGKSLGLLAKNMAGAAAGGKKQADAFDDVGVSVRTASGDLRPTNEVLGEIADRFQKMPDGPRKAAIAMQLFGKSGAQLIPLLNGGAAGLKESADEAERLGLVLSAETAQQAERFNDNLTRLEGAGRGFANAVMAGALPALEGLTGKLVDGIDVGARFNQIAEFTADVIALGASWFQELRYRVGLLVGPTLDAAGGLGGIADKAKAVVQWFEESGAKAVVLTVLYKGIAHVGLFISGVFKLVANRMKTFFGVLQAMVNGDFKGAARIFGEGFVDSMDIIGSTGREMLANLGAGIDETIGKAQGAKAGMTNLFAPVVAGAKQAGAALQVPADAIEEVGKKAKKEVNEALQSLVKLSDEVAQVGKTDAQKRFMDFEELAPSEEELAQFRALNVELERRNKLQAAGDELKKLRLETQGAGLSDQGQSLLQFQQTGANQEQLAEFKGLQQAKTQMESMKALSVEIAGGMQDAFEKFFFDPFGDGLSQALESFVSFIGQMIVKALAAAAVMAVLNILSGGMLSAGGAAAGASSNLLGATGLVGAFAGGGKVQGMGGPTGDKNLAFVSDDEWIINAHAVGRYGDALFAALNSEKIRGFAAGGRVGGGGDLMLPRSLGGGAGKIEVNVNGSRLSPAELERVIPRALRNAVLQGVGVVERDIPSADLARR